MKTIFKTAFLGVCLALLFMVDVPPEFPPHVQMVPEAHAIFGVWRRAARRTVIVGSSVAVAGAAAGSPAAASTISGEQLSPRRGSPRHDRTHDRGSRPGWVVSVTPLRPAPDVRLIMADDSASVAAAVSAA
jgi:hypothetical protein